MSLFPSYSRLLVYLASVLLLMTAMLGCSNDADFEAARHDLLAIGDELDAANAAAVAGDTEGAQQHRSEAQRLLRAAWYLYEEGGAAESDDPRVLVGYGDVLRQTGDFDLAAKMYRRATRSITDDATLWLNLGKSLSVLDERYLPEAKDAFERCTALTEDDNVLAEAHAELATVFRRMGLYEFAAEHLERTLELRPDDARARIFWAAHLARRGRIAEAAAALDEITELTPDLAARLHELLGSAMADFDAYRHVFDDTAQNHLAYAKLMLHIERNAESIPPLERSVALDPSNYVAWNLLGSASRVTGNADRAREAFERSLEINPNQPRTIEALEQLAATAPEAVFPPKTLSPQP